MRQRTRVLRRGRFLAAIIFLLAYCNLPGAAAEDAGARRIETIVDGLRRQLGIPANITVKVVADNRLAMSVEPLDGTKEDFLVSIDAAFLSHLDADELAAALAHELGHVWIFTHHPFLQTEALANQTAMRVVPRDSLKKLYVKLWAFEGTTGTIEDLLGAEPAATPLP
jgi:hypothetical protein